MEQSNVLHPGNRQQDVKPFAPKHFSKLNISDRFRTCLRFGQLGVCEVIDSIPRDDVPLRSAHSVRSYTLGSQMMSDVYLKKDFFQVPRRAILPENFEKVYNNPPLGDDVLSDVNSSVSDFTSKISSFFGAWFGQLINLSGANFFVDLILFLTSIQYFYSYGSLISALGYSFERFFDYQNSGIGDVLPSDGAHMSCDDFVDGLFTTFAQQVSSFVITVGTVTYTVYSGKIPYGLSGNNISLRRLLELIHDDPSQSLVLGTLGSDLSTWIADCITELTSGTLTLSSDSSSFDLAFPAAYQMVCAHFYSNDSIDFVYSADIYRQVVYSIFRDLLKVETSRDLETYGFFQYNGVQTPYDSLSSHIFDYIMSGLYNNRGFILRYFSVVFAWRNSLRFMDYFAGAKSRPLSIGNVNVAVVGNNVNVIDVITRTQQARFFNFANRARRKLEGYLEDLFGAKPSHDWHNPLYLGHMQDVIYSVDTENTGSAQLAYDPLTQTYSGAPNSVTSQFKSDGGERFAFQVDVQEPSVLIGIAYFDIPRCYAHATKRVFFNEDRFDMFNPFLQTIGDQALYLRELTDNLQGQSWDFPFGYKVRHAELKESFDRCKGGFATGQLSSWAFSDDTPARGESFIISPDFIRSSSTELDRFYLSLSHYSLGNYFHFIVTFYNGVVAKRDMIVNPTLL